MDEDLVGMSREQLYRQSLDEQARDAPRSAQP